jgi:hypothetical protein
MNFEQAKTDILNWVSSFVEQPHPLLNGWAPCPYARKARVDNLFDIRPGHIDPVSDCQHTEMGKFDVIAFVYDPATVDSVDFNQSISALNTNHLHARGLFALADHPADTEKVNGVVMNQGTWAICFLQDLNKLNSHARMLADRGYYTDWPEDYMAVLFDGRENPLDQGNVA